MNQEAHIYNPRYWVFMNAQTTINSMECPLFIRLERHPSGAHFKQCAGLSERQLLLLRRLLSRRQVEQLLRSRWLEQRVGRGQPVTREEVRIILDLARNKGRDWDHLLPERVNLASTESMVAFVLVPVFQWWVNRRDEAVASNVRRLAELQVHLRQLRAHEAFWRRAVAVAPQSSRAQLLGLEARQSWANAEIARLVSRLEGVSRWSRQAWPMWERGMAHYLASGKLDAFYPVPLVLTQLWQALESLSEDSLTVEAVRMWLYERNLCRIQDHFYWSSA